jgi:hypothetical protein
MVSHGVLSHQPAEGGRPKTIVITYNGSMKQTYDLPAIP